MKHSNLLRVLGVLIPLAGMLVSPMVLAQTNTAPITSVTDVKTVMCNIFGWMFYFLIVLSVMFVVIAAYRYLTAAGDPAAFKTANQQLLYAVIAIVVALLAKTLPTLVSSILGGGVLPSC